MSHENDQPSKFASMTSSSTPRELAVVYAAVEEPVLRPKRPVPSDKMLPKGLLAPAPDAAPPAPESKGPTTGMALKGLPEPELAVAPPAPESKDPRPGMADKRLVKGLAVVAAVVVLALPFPPESKDPTTGMALKGLLAPEPVAAPVAEESKGPTTGMLLKSCGVGAARPV